MHSGAVHKLLAIHVVHFDAYNLVNEIRI